MDRRPVMLITGASGSVGEAVAAEAAANGWALALHGRSADKLETLASELPAGTPAALIVGDVADDGAAERIVADARSAFGRIDAVVDCVSNGPREGRLTGLFKETSPEQYGAFYNLSAAWFQRLVHAAYPHLAERGGTLIGFISDAGKFAAPRQTIIGAARAAAIGFVRNLAVEAAHDGIRVHAISPSYILESRTAVLMGQSRTETAAKRAGLGLPTAADIAPVTVFLCGPGAAKITGQIISVNGGLNA